MVAGLTFYQIFQYFLIYSFLGWCTEVIYQAVSKGRIVNRGFLNGPVCPIYGFGVLAVFATVNTALTRADTGSGEENLLLVFLCGLVLTTSIELFGGWALDKIFHARWWDYSDKPFNFHGYICLEFSIIWGIGIEFIVEIVQPAIAAMSSEMPERVGWPLMGVIYTLYAADFILSVMIMVGLNKRLAELDEMQRRMRVVSNKLSEELGRGAIETVQHVDEVKVQAALARADARDSLSAAKNEAVSSLSAAKNEAVSSFSAAKNEAAESLSAVKNEVAESLSAAKNGIRTGLTDVQTNAGRRLNKLKNQYNRKSRALSHTIRSSRYFGLGRLLRAFPQMMHRDYNELLEELKRAAEEESDSIGDQR